MRPRAHRLPEESPAAPVHGKAGRKSKGKPSGADKKAAAKKTARRKPA